MQRNVWVLSVSMFINRSGSMVLLFTSLYLTDKLHFTIAQAGFVMSFYGIGSILGSYTGGWLTDRRNHFDIMFYSLIGSGLILLLMIFFTSYWAIAAIIFSYALVADMFRPANSAAIGAYSDPENRTRSVSLVRLAINLGFSIGPAIGGFIAMHFGYKLLFVMDACTSFGAAVLLWVYLPRKQNIRSQAQRDILSDKKTSAYRDYLYLFFIALVALYGTCFFQIFASIPQYFSKICHYNEGLIGLLLALNGLLVVLIEMPLVTWLEKKGNMFRYIVGGTLCIPVALTILWLGSGILFWAMMYTFILTIAEVLAMPFMMNYVLSQPVKERQGQYSALYSIGWGVANIIAPSVGLGIAGRFGFGWMFILFITLSFITAIGFVWVKRRNSLEKSR